MWNVWTRRRGVLAHQLQVGCLMTDGEGGRGYIGPPILVTMVPTPRIIGGARTMEAAAAVLFKIVGVAATAH